MAPQSPSASRSQMAVSRKQAPASIRVLIADDHAVVREGIRHVLSSDIGFEVVGEASDGAQAVSLATKLEPDVVVLDLSMPEVSGLDAAARIRATLPGVCGFWRRFANILRSLRYRSLGSFTSRGLNAAEPRCCTICSLYISAVGRCCGGS